MAFVSPQRGLVTVDPGYEAAARAAEAVGAPVTRVPLLKGTFGHDIPAMVAAAKKTNAGLIYVCNPNNPTGTVTPRKDVEFLLKNKPEGSIVLLDEAYLHFTDEPFGSDLIAKGEDVMVLRTFSKIYGMAGLRAGFAMAKPEILAKMKIWSSGAMPVTGMAAAHASIMDAELIPTRKKATAEIRNDVMAFLDKMGYEYTPSVSNKLMIDVRMPVQDFITSMASENVFVGRPWPAWPTWNRVSIGAEEEMGKFKVAFKKVMQS
jgi:histidinol-phosphate/aromatic aminotransferase/cobyric acid decarboxylase-like protein